MLRISNTHQNGIESRKSRTKPRQSRVNGDDPLRATLTPSSARMNPSQMGKNVYAHRWMCASRKVWPLIVSPFHSPMRAHDIAHAVTLSAAPAQAYQGMRARNGLLEREGLVEVLS